MIQGCQSGFVLACKMALPLSNSSRAGMRLIHAIQRTRHCRPRMGRARKRSFLRAARDLFLVYLHRISSTNLPCRNGFGSKGAHKTICPSSPQPASPRLHMERRHQGTRLRSLPHRISRINNPRHRKRRGARACPPRLNLLVSRLIHQHLRRRRSLVSRAPGHLALRRHRVMQ